jgi:hypothetical protein
MADSGKGITGGRRRGSAASSSASSDAPAKQTSAKKAPAKKTSAKKAPAKKAPAKKAPAKKAPARKAPARASSQKGTAARRAATPSRRASTLTASGRSGDLIVIDSPQVGSPPREGEVLEVIHGDVSVSYRVRWADGHQTLIAPKSGTARIVRAAKRA